jgi:hypothetical protein
MDDKEMRDALIFGALIGLVIRGESTLDSGYLAIKYADETMEARNKVDEDGIASVKIKSRKKSVSE